MVAANVCKLPVYSQIDCGHARLWPTWSSSGWTWFDNRSQIIKIDGIEPNRSTAQTLPLTLERQSCNIYCKTTQTHLFCINRYGFNISWNQFVRQAGSIVQQWTAKASDRTVKRMLRSVKMYITEIDTVCIHTAYISVMYIFTLRSVLLQLYTRVHFKIVHVVSITDTAVEI